MRVDMEEATLSCQDQLPTAAGTPKHSVTAPTQPQSSWGGSRARVRPIPAAFSTPTLGLGDSPADAGSRGSALPISSIPFPLPPWLFASKYSPWHSLSLTPPAERAAARRVPSSWSRNTGGAGREKGWQGCTGRPGTCSIPQGSTRRQRWSREAGISLNIKQGGPGERKMRKDVKDF